MFVDFDGCLVEVMEKLIDDDLLIIIVDYGNDLIYFGIDYICEFVLLFVYLLCFKNGGLELELCKIFVDFGVIVVDNFEVKMFEYGISFLKDLK